MSNLIEASPEEPRGGGGGNRVFVLMALGLAGLLVLGLLLVFGYLLLQRLQPRPGPTPILTEIAGTPVGTAPGGTRAPTSTLSPGAATATALAPTATATRVVGGASPTPPSGTGALQATRPPNVTSAPGGASPTPGTISQATASPTATTAGAALTATPTPSENLPSTGVETDMLVIGVLMVLLLLIARGFRIALR